MDEIWKPIKDYPKYEVSNRGRIRSFKRVVSRKECYFSLIPNSQGYIRIGLLNKGEKLKLLHVHRLVLEAFVGPCPHSYQCNHKDGNPRNNYVDNLEWVTPSENRKHAFRIGLQSHKGEHHNNSKLSNADVKKIRLLSSVASITQLANLYDVDYSTIYRIAKNQSRI